MLDIFLTAPPGLESLLANEAEQAGFIVDQTEHGGVTINGGWPDVWRANLMLRGASHVLVRLGSFKANHLAKLDKQAAAFPWADILQDGVPVKVEVTCKKSRIYHSKAAAERIERGIMAAVNAPISDDADVVIKARLLNDVCTISVDSSGEPLHKRGHKQVVNKAPMRENLAAMLLAAAGYQGSEPIIDPMCGSGTFVIEAAEIASKMYPGRSRAFAFEQLKTFDPAAWNTLKTTGDSQSVDQIFYGFDRDAGAIKMSAENAAAAGVETPCQFAPATISELTPPSDTTGLIIVNPPYGVRIGQVKKLLPLYQSLGRVLLERFSGWRVAIATNSHDLARATKLPFDPKPLSFDHGGTRVKLYIAVIK